ncbi:uncharacterized protein LOC134802800 [Cydia splendana]|uniref:uncharacterized protein LOC134802800 n=1 Tax=Cydia splendana TaxID=1100963 RepID=UPI0028F4B342
MIFVSAISLFLLMSPFISALVNYTFNKNLIPHNMKEFQEQTRDFKFTNPLTAGELEIMIANTESVIPNFEMDLINDTSRRFENLKAIYEKKNYEKRKKGKPVKNILSSRSRGNLSDDAAVKRAFDLMSQFVYGARYKLAYGQALRMQYSSTIEYKIGYCFALMRDIRQQQLSLYSTMYYGYKQHVETLYNKESSRSHEPDLPLESYFAMYHKVMKLELDMKDVVNLAQKLMDMRWQNPNTTSKEGIFK